jgi:hypothetical protein
MAGDEGTRPVVQLVDPPDQPLASPSARDAAPTIASVTAGLSAIAGVTVLIATLGGVVVWSRIRGAGVPVEEVFGVIPKQEFIVVGARQLLLPVIIGIGFYWLQGKMWPDTPRPGPETKPDPKPRAEPFQGPVGRRIVWLASRRPVRLTLRAILWLLRRVWAIIRPLLVS